MRMEGCPERLNSGILGFVFNFIQSTDFELLPWARRCYRSGLPCWDSSTPSGHLAVSGHGFGVITWWGWGESAVGIQWVEGRGANEHPAVLRHPHGKNGWP